MAKAKKKNLFGKLTEHENMHVASQIVEDLSTVVPQRDPFLCTSPSMSWSSAVGYYYGAMELLYGPKSSGKTMIALDRIKMILNQNPEHVVAFVDAELDFEFDSTVRWMRGNGVDTDRVLIIREVNIKKIFELHILERLQTAIKDDGVQLGGIVFDSIAAMGVKEMPNKLNKKTLDNLTKQDHGARANYLARIFPFYRQFVRQYRPYSCFINQARFSGKDFFGNPIYDTNGGEALFHEMQYRYLIMQDTSQDSAIMAENTKDANGNPVQIGHRIKYVCQKNKMGEGLGREGHMDIVYMKGIVNVETEVANLASKLGIIKQTGAWYEIDGQKFNGASKVAEYLKSNGDEYTKLLNAVMLDAANSDKYTQAQA